MKNLTIDKKQIELIQRLTQFSSVTIVWDINAFYFNTEKNTYKLECFDEIPEGSHYKYDEIFYCTFSDLKERIEFEENNPKFWYKIISNECKIIGIKYLNVCELFPDNELVSIANIGNDQCGLNKSTIGLIIETDKGFLPAFILPSNHGFQWQPKFEFYSELEIEKLIAEKIKYYEIKNCA